MSAKVSMLFTKIKNPKRVKAILLVFLLGAAAITTITVVTITTVVPDLVKLGKEMQVEEIESDIKSWIIKNKASSWGKILQLQEVDVNSIDLQQLVKFGDLGDGDMQQLASKGFSEVIIWIGLVAGMALVPVYVFYFLLEARTIEMKWSDYLPLKESWFKEEAVFVLQSFNDSMVVFFRGQAFTPAQHVAFARNFGELEVHPFIPSNTEEPELVRFEKDADTTGYENQWHHDVTWRECPSKATILRAIEVPDVGGDTLFADMYAAYEVLHADVKAEIDDLEAIHEAQRRRGHLSTDAEVRPDPEAAGQFWEGEQAPDDDLGGPSNCLG